MKAGQEHELFPQSLSIKEFAFDTEMCHPGQVFVVQHSYHESLLCSICSLQELDQAGGE